MGNIEGCVRGGMIPIHWVVASFENKAHFIEEMLQLNFVRNVSSLSPSFTPISAESDVKIHEVLSYLQTELL
jgi:hypothetical protein